MSDGIKIKVPVESSNGGLEDLLNIKMIREKVYVSVADCGGYDCTFMPLETIIKHVKEHFPTEWEALKNDI